MILSMGEGLGQAVKAARRTPTGKGALEKKSAVRRTFAQPLGICGLQSSDDGNNGDGREVSATTALR